MKRLLQFPLLVWHRVVAPAFPPMCRFHPSCSIYAVEAIEKHPLHRALWLAARRLLRCHPFHPGGFDPVPDPAEGEGDAEGDPGALRTRAGSLDRETACS